MAVAVLGHYDENNVLDVMRPIRRLDRRHYKKDSRFVLDLYTLTYDEHESLDSLGDLTDVSIDFHLFPFLLVHFLLARDRLVFCDSSFQECNE